MHKGNQFQSMVQGLQKYVLAPPVFRERFIKAAVTSPLISMGRLLIDGWHLQNEGDGTMNRVRKHRHIPVHFKRNSLCATGVIRMLTENTDVSSSTSSSSGQVQSAEHVRALTLCRALTGMGQGWIQLSENVFGLRSISPNHVDTTYCPSSGLLWLCTTLIKGDDGEWELEEFGQSIAELPIMIGPFNTEKRVVESITIAHTSMVSPEHLGFSVSDDIIAPRSGIPVRPLQPADAAEPAEQPDVDVIPAAEDAEPPVEAREDGMEHHEVWVDGVRLHSAARISLQPKVCRRKFPISNAIQSSSGPVNLQRVCENHPNLERKACKRLTTSLLAQHYETLLRDSLRCRCLI